MSLGSLIYQTTEYAGRGKQSVTYVLQRKGRTERKKKKKPRVLTTKVGYRMKTGLSRSQEGRRKENAAC